MNRKNNTEDLMWDSVDALVNELHQVAFEGVRQGVNAEDIANYIQAEAKTLVNMLRTGKLKEFDDIYREFIDEVVENGRYGEWMDFLRFREGLSDVHMS